MPEPDIFRLIRTKKIHGADYDALIETSCSECFIRVSGFKDPDLKSIFVSQLSGHPNATWSWRRTRIWRILRGLPDPDYEILDVGEVDALIEALRECREAIFGDYTSVPPKPEGIE